MIFLVLGSGVSAYPEDSSKDDRSDAGKSSESASKDLSEIVEGFSSFIDRKAQETPAAKLSVSKDSAKRVQIFIARRFMELIKSSKTLGFRSGDFRPPENGKKPIVVLSLNMQLSPASLAKRREYKALLLKMEEGYTTEEKEKSEQLPDDFEKTLKDEIKEFQKKIEGLPAISELRVSRCESPSIDSAELSFTIEWEGEINYEYQVGSVDVSKGVAGKE